MRRPYLVLLFLTVSRLGGGLQLSWPAVGVPRKLEAKLVKQGASKPTSIQAASLPKIIRGEDVVISAETGSGKTLAYALGPVIQKRPTIVVAPTQILCWQIRRVVADLTDETENMDRLALFLAVLQGAPRCAVVTPKDALLGLKTLKNQTTTRMPSSDLCLILDEADALLKPLGRYASDRAKQMRAQRDPPGLRIAQEIINITGQDKTQLIAASATVGRPLRRLLDRLIGRTVTVVQPPPDLPQRVLAKKQEEPQRRAVTVPVAVEKHFIAPYVETKKPQAKNLPSYFALAAVFATLRALTPYRSLLVLASDDDNPQQAAYKLRKEGFIHAHDMSDGPPSANDDDPCLEVSPIRLLRGIDLPKLDLVIILGRPRTPDDYLHAVGRAGRQGFKGLAVTLAQARDVKVLASWATQLDLVFDELDDVKDLKPPDPAPSAPLREVVKG